MSAGYLPVGDLGVDLRAVDVRMAHHPGDALYRDAGGQRQGPERMPGHVVGQVLLHAQCHAHSMYLVPEDIADRQREYRPVVIRGVVKFQYLSGYGCSGMNASTSVLARRMRIDSLPSEVVPM